MADFDTRAFRNALGAYATGVTIITARDRSGRLAGLTVNSFTSVSLDPPLVLWSMSLYSASLATFQDCSHYAVNVLSRAQEQLARRFAVSQTDKFAGLEFAAGAGGAPLLPGCCAWFECRNEARHSGGDHLIFVGQVERFSCHDLPPLLFHAGRYRSLAEQDQA